MARHVKDLELMLSVIAGADGKDPNVPAIDIKPDDSKIDFSKLKVAYYTDNGITPQQEIQDVVLDTVKALEGLGAKVTKIKPNNIGSISNIHWEIFFLLADGGGCNDILFKDLPDDKISNLRKDFNKLAKKSRLTVTEMNLLFVEIAKFKTEMFSFLSDYDVLVCPPCATVAKPHGESLAQLADFSYTMPFNVSGSPAMTLKTSKTANGLPIGVQLVANLWRDYFLLKVARELEGIL